MSKKKPSKTWLRQLEIMRALTVESNVAIRTGDHWRWGHATAMPSLAGTILMPLFQADLVTEDKGRLALTASGRARLLVEEKVQRHREAYSGELLGKKAQPWHLVKCQCGHPVCDKHTVEGGGVFSTFYQGCGWSLRDAQRICDILNAHWSTT